ncbi:hypothetical protein LX81_01339 [Palleronia aestuarii]|uniref:Uncharacterized protein n=1 Tax=Palleronia aestuarii TaxID=568105 RepID=A0A2W7NLS9_9RHOB|nr:hypothetical protein [Palleronia aestuarii]PZX17614.1 hypothetical protein LX81_01339 [Palleronia aestuarii]
MSSPRSISVSWQFTVGAAPDFWALSTIVTTCLGQADVKILRQDIAMRGDRVEFETDHGKLTILSEGDGYVTATMDIDAICPHETARQICFLLSRRVAGRFALANIHWHPTMQTLPPVDFTWGALRDMPYRFVAPASEVRPSYLA